MHTVQSLLSIILTVLAPLLALLLGYSALQFFAKHSKPPEELPSISLSLALGWGLLSYALCLVAAVGSVFSVNLFQRWVAFLGIAIVVGLLRNNLIEIKKMLVSGRCDGKRELASDASKIHKLGTYAIVAILAALILRLLLTALTPSFLYDVLEYHIPDARWIVSTGSLRPIHGNSYSLMPQGVEILFAFGKLLEGHFTEHAPKLIHLFLGLSAAALLNAILKEFAVAGWLRGVGIILFLSHPISFKLFADAYVDFGPALYGTAAILCWLRSKRLGGKWYPILAAIFLGFALSAKYPALGVLVLPFLVFLAPMSRRQIKPAYIGRRHAIRRGIVLLFLSGTITFITYSPWLVRVLLVDASPFPPLTLPGPWAHVSSQELGLRAFMAQAHGLVSPFSMEFWLAVVRRADVMGSLLFVGMIFFVGSPRSDYRLQRLSLFAFVGYLMWNLRTDSADRFLSPLLPVFVALGILLVHETTRFFPRYGRWVVLPFIMWTGFLVYGQTAQAIESKWLGAGLGLVSRGEFLENQLGMTARFFEAINRATSDDPKARVLLLYEARSAAVDAPTISNTVFDPCPLWGLLQSPVGTNPEAVLALLRRMGVTHIAGNEVELARLVKTYPAPAAREDPAFRAADSLPAPGGFQPAFLALRKYYAPFFYMSDEPIRELEQRLDRFLDRAQQDAVWEDNLGGARLFVAQVRP